MTNGNISNVFMVILHVVTHSTIKSMWFLQKCVTAFRIRCISHVSIIPLRRSLYTKPCFIGKTDAHFPLLIILLAKRNICIKEMQKCAIRQYPVHSMNNLNHKKFVSRSILFVFNANLCSSFILLSSLILYSLIKARGHFTVILCYKSIILIYVYTYI